ncbi:MAG: hypothetical protein ABJA37_15490 [Ferruginibacter sp.]
MKNVCLAFLSYMLFGQINAQEVNDKVYPSNTEVVTPIHKKDFNNGNVCPERRQGGNRQIINGYQVFNGSMDGNRQVDPQIAVGGGYVMEGSNSGIVIYNKKGEFVQGVSQKCFNNGIDPKMFFDIHNKVFVFDLWWYYDKEKTKPVNISVSETSNPTGAWNIYPVSRTQEVDGGGIGYSKKWIGYSYPGGKENSFIMRMADAIAGKPATIYHFKGSLGHPVFMQDAIDDLYFFDIEDDQFVIRKLSEAADGKPYCQVVSRKPHQLKYIDYPPQSPQKGTEQKVSSGDRNPKNLVFQNGSIWFSQAVNCNEGSAVQWHQVNAATGKIIQTGLIKNDTSNYIQTTIAVNKKNDVLIGFQEVNGNSFISPRFAYRLKKDKPGTIRKIVSAGEGKGATDGASWGDYSGCIIDGDNLLDLWTIQSITNIKGKSETVILKVPFKRK